MVTDKVFDENYKENHKKYADADTRIWDKDDYYRYGYKCSNTRCSYIVKDCAGEWACCGSRYKRCSKSKNDNEEISDILEEMHYEDIKAAIREVRVSIGAAVIICKENGKDDITDLLEEMKRCLKEVAHPYYGVELHKK